MAYKSFLRYLVPDIAALTVVVISLPKIHCVVFTRCLCEHPCMSICYLKYHCDWNIKYLDFREGKE